MQAPSSTAPGADRADRDSTGTAWSVILNGAVVALALWLFASPFVLRYAPTEAANDIGLAQIGTGILIGAGALPRMREPHRHPRLIILTLAGALLLVCIPWLLGAATDGASAGLPPGPADNGYAPAATANAVGTGLAVIALTLAAMLTRRNRGPAAPVDRDAPAPSRKLHA